MYFNSIVCLLISVFSLYTSHYIYKNNKNNLADISYAIFWFFVSMTWLFVMISLLLYKNGFFDYDIFLNQFGVQTAIFMQMAAGAYFVAFRTTKNNNYSLIIFLVVSLASLVGLYYDYRPGSLYATKSTFASVEYQIDGTAWIVFQSIFSVVMLGMALDFIRNLFYWIKKSPLFEVKYFFACMAAIIYGLVGYFDQAGIYASWVGVLFRLSIILCASIAYLAYSEKEI